MKLHFYGADKEVTGSCHMIEAGGKKILIDCGLQQGSDEKSNNTLPFRASEIDSVVITHAHIDHSGRLPLLVKEGFSGQIYATGATCRLMNIMLLDSAHIQEQDALWQTRKGQRHGEPPVQPLYTREDARATAELFHPCSYGYPVRVNDNLKITFTDAGHLLGSAFVTAEISERGHAKTVVFSGDIGNKDQPILRNPQPVTHADYVVMETTYGDRSHERLHYKLEDLAHVIGETLRRGGNAVVPAFAVGRMQQLLYHIREIKERKLIPDFPVYVDSPLALEATKIYDGDLQGYADDETLAILARGFHPLRFPNLHLCQSTEESMALNEDKTPKVILSASGMCDAGRVRHHLKHNLWRKESAVIFAGYVANGTLGRILLDGAERVKLFGEEIAVNAQIHNFRGLSAHADQEGLISFATGFAPRPARVILVHGEATSMETFSSILEARGLPTFMPNYRAAFDLLSNSVEHEGVQPVILKKQRREAAQSSPVFGRLLRAGERVMDVIRQSEGGANKDLAKFADQLTALAEKWER